MTFRVEGASISTARARYRWFEDASPVLSSPRPPLNDFRLLRLKEEVRSPK